MTSQLTLVYCFLSLHKSHHQIFGTCLIKEIFSYLFCFLEHNEPASVPVTRRHIKFDIPGVARAVLQNIINHKQWELGSWTFERIFTPTTCHISHGTCNMSHFTCQVSRVTCHVSCFTSHVSHVTIYIYIYIYLYIIFLTQY